MYLPLAASGLIVVVVGVGTVVFMISASVYNKKGSNV